MTKPILPPATLGIVGGGQLGQMMALAAKPMGYRVVVLDPQINAPAAQIADQQLVANYDDESALRNLADIADVITYEFENVSQEALANAVPAKQLPQGTQLLHITANRLREKHLSRIWDCQLRHLRPSIMSLRWMRVAIRYHYQQS